MIDRRLFVAGTLAKTVAGLPVPAQHQDLGVTMNDRPAQQQHRWRIEAPYAKAVTNEDMQGKFTLICLGDTGCPDVCPTTLPVIAEAMDALGDQAEMVVPLFVTVDPDRDTAVLMREYPGSCISPSSAFACPRPTPTTS